MKTAQPVISAGFYKKLMEQKQSHETKAMAFMDGQAEAYMLGNMGDCKMFTEAYNKEVEEIHRIDMMLKRYTQHV